MTNLIAGEDVDSATLVGDVEPHWHAYADNDDPTEVSIVWTEETAFHTDVRHLELLEGEGLREGVTEALETELRRLLKHEDVYVQRSDQGVLAMEIVVGLTCKPATIERLADLAWPVIATLTNVFDPGTFNAEYVMGNVARTLEDQ